MTNVTTLKQSLSSLKNTMKFKKEATERKKIFATFKNDNDCVLKSMNNSKDQ